MRSLFHLVFPVLLSALSCATSTPRAEPPVGVLARAAYDLRCPEEELLMTVLEGDTGPACGGSRVLVRGCGARASYTCDGDGHWRRELPVSVDEN